MVKKPRTNDYLKEGTRLAGIDQKRLLSYVENMLTIQDDDSDSVKVRKTNLRKRYAKFEDSYSLQNMTKTKHLTYEVLPNFMKATGLSYGDILEITNDPDGGRAKINWASDVEAKMCSACDAFSSDNARQTVYDLVLRTLPDPLKENLFSKERNAVRAFAAARNRQVTYNDVRKKIFDNKRLLTRFVYASNEGINSHSVLPLHTYNELIQHIDVSPHWLLGLDENTCILAKNGLTELIMDAFCLLPDEWKQIIYTATKSISKEF